MSAQPEDRFYRQLCLHAGVGLIATDDQLRVRCINAAVERIFGEVVNKMLGRPIVALFPPDQYEPIVEMCEHALHEGRVSEFDYRHQPGPNQHVNLAIKVSPIIDDAGRRVGVSASICDVTQRIQLIGDLADQQRMSALSSMAGAIAHHFNNFLGGVITTVDFAQNSDDPKTLRRALQSSLSALLKANDLTAGLLAFAEGDRSESPRESIIETVKQFIEKIKPRLAERRIHLKTDLQPIQALMPAKPITTILECVVTNAYEAMIDGGILRIELAEASGDKIVLRIADTGEGLAQEHLPHVFEPFFTTKRSATFYTEHVGLGLAVVHGIVKDLGGTVTLNLGPTGGVICCVRLPVRKRFRPH